jgi:hypothetical protein
MPRPSPRFWGSREQSSKITAWFDSIPPDYFVNE